MTSMDNNTFFSFIGLKDQMIKQINHQIYLKFRIGLISVKIFLKVKIHIFIFFYFWVYFPTFLHGASLQKRSIKSKMAITIELFKKMELRYTTFFYHLFLLQGSIMDDCCCVCCCPLCVMCQLSREHDYTLANPQTY